MDKLILSGDITLEKDIVTFPALRNQIFRISSIWGGSDDTMNLCLAIIGELFYELELEIRGDEYIFYGYDYTPDGYTKGVLWSRKF